jgi:hypothetical protein
LALDLGGRPEIIRIYRRNVAAGRRSYSGISCSSDASVILPNNANASVNSGMALRNNGSIVCGSVVDNDYLEVPMRLRSNTVQCIVDGCPSVIGGDDNGDQFLIICSG